MPKKVKQAADVEPIPFPSDVKESEVIGFYPHERPLVRGTFLKRRDRFLADVRLDACGTEIEAHCVNPGRMEGLLPAPEDTDRKCKFTWELLEHKGLLCGTQTSRPNQVMKKLLEERKIPGLDDWIEIKPECVLPEKFKEAHGRSRIDFWLRHADGQEHYIEIKNCHMVYEDGYGYFPDSVSERAAKHMGALQALKEAGYRTTSLFLVVRGDCANGARPSDFHDPWFAKAVRAAAQAGVEFRGFRAQCRTDGYLVDKEIPVDVEPYDTTEIARQWEENRPTTGWIRTFPPNANTQVANGEFTHNKPGFWERKAKAAASRAKDSKKKIVTKPKVKIDDKNRKGKVKTKGKPKSGKVKQSKTAVQKKKSKLKKVVKPKKVGKKATRQPKKVAKKPVKSRKAKKR